jgi:predicted outer membrane repeat protein
MLSGSAGAVTYIVNPDGNGDFPTIQAAIDDPGVLDGDIIELTDGTFTGEGNRDVDYRGKAVTVRSQSGDSGTCIIDCEGSSGHLHRGFVFHAGEGPGSVLRDVTVRNGYSSPQGGAISCLASAPTIDGCSFYDNYSLSGGAISIEDNVALMTVRDCWFQGNEAESTGGAVYTNGGAQVSIEGCVITGNRSFAGGGVTCGRSAQIFFRSCTISGNMAAESGFAWGGGLVIFDNTVVSMENASCGVIAPKGTGMMRT